MKTHYKYFRWAAYVIEILILFVLQQTAGLIPEIYGQRPIILIPVLLTIAMFENERVGAGFGIFIGFIMDIGYGKVLGYNAIILAIIGYIVGAMAVNFIKTNLLTIMLVSAVCVFVVLSFQFIFFYAIKGYGELVYTFQNHYLPRMFYTIMITPIVYYFNLAFALDIKPKEE